MVIFKIIILNIITVTFSAKSLMRLSIGLAEDGIYRIGDSIASLFGKSLNRISVLIKKVSFMNSPSVKELPFQATN